MDASMFDRLSRAAGAGAGRRTVFGALAAAAAGLVAARKAGAADKATGLPYGQSGYPSSGARERRPSAAKAKKISVARCDCYRFAEYLFGGGEMFCFYNTHDEQQEELCNDDQVLCADLAAACKIADANACVDAVVLKWGS
jgi:hypothetical protein